MVAGRAEKGRPVLSSLLYSVHNAQQWSKLKNPQLVSNCNISVIPLSKAHNLDFIFDNHLNVDNQIINALSQSSFYHTQDLGFTTS